MTLSLYSTYKAWRRECAREAEHRGAPEQPPPPRPTAPRAGQTPRSEARQTMPDWLGIG